MKILLKVKLYLFEPRECFIPRCKARCCADASLPEGYAQQVEGFACRKIYNAVNIGKNDPSDNYNSIVYNTRPLPLTLIGHAGRGKHAYFFDKKMAKEMNISAEEAKAMLQSFEAQEVYNYCPFLNEQGRCRVYPMRPPICREFGTSPLPINHCSRKSSRYDKFKYYSKEIFKYYRDLIFKPFRKAQKAT